MNNRINKICIIIKENFSIISTILTAMGTIILFLIKLISNQLSYGYSSYYGIGNIKLKNNPINNSNIELLIIVIVFLLIIILVSIAIKIEYFKCKINAIFYIIMLSSIISNIIFILALRTNMVDYGTLIKNFSYMIIIQILMIVIDYLFIKRIRNRCFKKIVSIILIIINLFYVVYKINKVFNNFHNNMSYYLLMIIILMLIVGFSLAININNNEKQNKVEIKDNNQTSVENENNKGPKPSFFIMFILVLVIVFILFVNYTRKELIKTGKELASMNSNNIITNIDGITYLCLYTENDEILAIPVIIENENTDKEQIVITSNEYRYIDRYDNLVFRVHISKVITNFK